MLYLVKHMGNFTSLFNKIRDKRIFQDLIQYVLVVATVSCRHRTKFHLQYFSIQM